MTTKSSMTTKLITAGIGLLAIGAFLGLAADGRCGSPWFPKDRAFLLGGTCSDELATRGTIGWVVAATGAAILLTLALLRANAEMRKP